MAMQIHVDLVSAEEEIFSGPATMVYAPAQMGEVGISPRHAPLLTRLKPGEVRLEMQNGDEKQFYVSGGILEIQPHVVTILSDTAIRDNDLDEASALKAKQQAEETMKNVDGDKEDIALAEAEFRQAIAQLRIIESLRKKRK